jgi:hypothetical protein
MRLRWKDAVAALVMAASTGVYVAYLRGVDLPLVASTRGTIAAVLVLGIAGGCALAEVADLYQAQTLPTRIYAVIANLLGVAALSAAVIGLITASAASLRIEYAAVFLLWLGATARHSFPHPGRHVARDGEERGDRAPIMH